MEIMRAIALGIVILSFITAIYFYPQMPEQMASHWNINGQVDGYTGKGVGVFFMPILSLAMFFLFVFLPKLDPMKQNYKAFINEYNALIALLIGFFYYIYLLTMGFNLGYEFDFTRFLSPAFGILFYFLGVVIQKAKQNWFVGIRTPWTLSSERVWEKTHKISGDLFKAAGIVALLGVVLPQMLLASVAVILASAIFGVVFSYIEFNKEKKGK